jgi:anthranilate phosphoribosyltransferase
MTSEAGLDASKLLERLLSGRGLGESEAAALLEEMAAGRLEAALAGALLAALRAKGESAEEIRGFANAMRRLARRPQIAAGGAYVDLVGTGGDASGSLNLSTGSALLAAACGAAVVKHGNRSVSSRSGSADVLAALGMPIPLDEAQAGTYLQEVGFTFLFAPHYHPAMKHIAPVRAALGVRTVFNILGPLANPAAPPFHVIGAFSEAMARLMAETLSGMDIERAFVVHGAEGWDEATPVGPFVCFDVRPGSVHKTVRDPAVYGFARCSSAALRGGDAAANARRLEAALSGGDQPAHRDALALGAALALEVTGQVADPAAAVECARAAIDSGAARRTLEKLAELGRRGAS